MTIKIIFTLVLSFFTSDLIQLAAQDTTSYIKYNDIIRLKSGLVVKCKILDFDEKGTFIEKKNQDTLYILNDDHKIIYQNGASKIIKEADKKLYEKKWLTTIEAGLAIGYADGKEISGTTVSLGYSRRIDQYFNHSVRCGLSFLSTQYDFEDYSNGSDILNFTFGYQYNFFKGNNVPFAFADFGKHIYHNHRNQFLFDRFDKSSVFSINAGIGMELKKEFYSYRISAS